MSDEALLAWLSAADRKEFLALSEEDKDAVRDSFKQRIPPTADLRALAESLFKRAQLGDGRIPARQAFETAKIHECLKNAVAWVEAHPGHRLVYGYTFFHFEYGFPHVRFTPHVVVETEAGEWLDVTPHNSLEEHPFLQHAGAEAQFHAALDNGHMDHVYR